MKIALRRKQMAVTSSIKEIVIPGTFDEYYQDGTPAESYWGRNKVNEKLLIENIPGDFLGSLVPSKLSISVEMERSEKTGSSLGNRGQTNMEFFSAEERNYSLLLLRE